MLAIIWAVKYFRPYIYGVKFTIVRDHKLLIWLMNFKEPSSKLIRWRLQFMEYNFEIIHKKASQNVIADALSRADPNLNHNETLTVKPCTTSEKRINEFNTQLILEIDTNTSCQTTTPFKQKLRKKYSQLSFDFDNIAKILKGTPKANRIRAFLADDNNSALIEKAFLTYFTHKKHFKIIRCKSLLHEIVGNPEQNKFIQEYHSNSNHRGIRQRLPFT